MADSHPVIGCLFFFRTMIYRIVYSNVIIKCDRQVNKKTVNENVLKCF
jgi:hypothetical protein